ncbi:MAG: HAD family hydrolase [Spirochaetaceae bacterium]|nr:HAD family hydrolase [Spirochaetaceae bacterium]
MAITHVLFDLDDTLVAEESSAEAAFLATCEHARERYGVDPHALHRAVRERAREAWFAAPTNAYCQAVGIASWEGLWARFPGDDPNLKALRRRAPAYRREAWSRALADFGVRDAPFAERLASIFPAERRARHVVFPDVEDTLVALHGSWRLAILTNGTPGLQREKIAGSGLAHYFDAVTVAGEVGVGKPDPRAFSAALEAAGARPGQTVMVGDNLRRDVQGAQQAGMRAFWLNRTGRKPELDVMPDAEMTATSELPALLRRG